MSSRTVRMLGKFFIFSQSEKLQVIHYYQKSTSYNSLCKVNYYSEWRNKGWILHSKIQHNEYEEGEIAINKNDCEKLRIQMSKEIWLSFFNEYLFRNGLITQEERLKMNGKIASYISRIRKWKSRRVKIRRLLHKTTYSYPKY